jgi:DHA2 family lincomycin resistance protein-like MFS transporter
LIAALAPGFGVLMTGRIVQAVGTAVMIPLLMTTVLRLVPQERRGAMMGTITVVIAVAPAIGPTLSGVILTALGWRWMFWIVLPIALLALAAGARWLRVAAETRRIPLDVPSVVLSALAFGGLVFGLSSVGESARGEALVNPWIPTVVGAVAMVVFVRRQLRLQGEGRALLDLRPLGFRPFAVAIVLVVLSMMSLFGVLILLPLYLQDVLRVSPFVTGLAVLPGGLVMGLLGPVVGRLYDRIGARPLVVPGAVVLALALWAFTTLGASSPLWMIIGMHVVLVIGLSLMLTPLITDALGQLPGELDSHGSAILATLQQVAGAAGTALFITVMSLASADATAGTDVQGARAAFLCAAVIATIALPLTLLIGRREPAAANA